MISPQVLTRSSRARWNHESRVESESSRFDDLSDEARCPAEVAQLADRTQITVHSKAGDVVSLYRG